MSDALRKDIPISQPTYCKDSQENIIPGTVMYNWMHLRAVGPNCLKDNKFCGDNDFTDDVLIEGDLTVNGTIYADLPPVLQETLHAMQCYLNLGEILQIPGVGIGVNAALLGQGNFVPPPPTPRNWALAYQGTPSNEVTPIFDGPKQEYVDPTRYGVIGITNIAGNGQNIVAIVTLTADLRITAGIGNPTRDVIIGLNILRDPINNIDQPTAPSRQVTKFTTDSGAFNHIVCKSIMVIPNGGVVTASWSATTGVQFEVRSANIVAEFVDYCGSELILPTSHINA